MKSFISPLHTAQSPVGPFQKVLQRVLQDLCKPERVLELVLAHKLARRKPKPSRKEIAAAAKLLARHISRGDQQPFTFRLGDDKKTLRRRSIELTAKDIEWAERRLTKSVDKIIGPLAEEFAAWVLKNGRRALRPYRGTIDGFEGRLRKFWGQGLDNLELFIRLAEQAGSEANDYLRGKIPKAMPHLIDALTRLHARACQVASEIHTLLKSGYADGAHARWRTLHEIEVVAALLSKHGDELARRYMEHQHWDSWKAAVEFNSHAHKSRGRRFGGREMARMGAKVDALRKEFGDDYVKDKGWAASIVANPKRVIFRDLEDAADLDHVIPHYRHASLNVHADPRAFNAPLGLMGDGRTMIASGPTNAGLHEAGMQSPGSLLNVTLCLLTADVTLDSLVYGRVLMTLHQRTTAGFARAAALLVAKERKLHEDARAMQRKN